MEIKTPSYIFDIKTLKDRISFIRENLAKDIRICYAMKANPFLVEYLIDVVDAFEVCSPGEYQICKALNVPKDKIVLSGVFKEEEDIKGIVKDCKDLPIYTVESLSQLNLLTNVAKENNLVLNVYLRLSSGNQFGVDEETIKKIVSNLNIYNSINVLGIQLYSGTQKKIDVVQKELDYLHTFIASLEETYGIRFKHFEYGPGLRVNYFTSEPDFDEKGQLNILNESLKQFDKYQIQLEMGRFIAYNSGEYHTKIVDTKFTNNMSYCIIDGGINQLNYYGQTMAMKPPFIKTQKDSGDLAHWTICGSLCTVADVIIKNYPLYDAKIGDELVFLNVGAYSITEGIYLFLSRDLPRVYIRDEKGNISLKRDVINAYKINMKGEN